jgi:hypothetical protein
MTISEFIATHGLGFTSKRVSPDLFRCRITCDERGMNFFHHSPTVPTLVETLTRIAKAAQQHVNSNLYNGVNASRDMASFQHWCTLYGYSVASPEDRERYIVIRRRAEQLKYVIGTAAFKELLEITDGAKGGRWHRQ